MTVSTLASGNGSPLTTTFFVSFQCVLEVVAFDFGCRFLLAHWRLAGGPVCGLTPWNFSASIPAPQQLSEQAYRLREEQR
jgi:hypothetical protein